jgi:hypothetical protein
MAEALRKSKDQKHSIRKREIHDAGVPFTGGMGHRGFDRWAGRFLPERTERK